MFNPVLLNRLLCYKGNSLRRDLPQCRPAHTLTSLSAALSRSTWSAAAHSVSCARGGHVNINCSFFIIIIIIIRSWRLSQGVRVSCLRVIRVLCPSSVRRWRDTTTNTTWNTDTSSSRLSGKARTDVWRKPWTEPAERWETHWWIIHYHSHH